MRFMFSFNKLIASSLSHFAFSNWLVHYINLVLFYFYLLLCLNFFVNYKAVNFIIEAGLANSQGVYPLFIGVGS